MVARVRPELPIEVVPPRETIRLGVALALIVSAWPVTAWT
jgi:hypothetical protein